MCDVFCMATDMQVEEEENGGSHLLDGRGYPTVLKSPDVHFSVGKLAKEEIKCLSTLFQY